VFYNLYKFKTIIRRISPDILHAFNVRKAGWLAVLSKFKPVIVSPQGGDVMVNERNYSHIPIFKRWLKKSFIDKKLRIYTLKNACVITFGNETMLNSICEWVHPKKPFKHFQGIDFNNNKTRRNIDTLKKQLGIQGNKIVFSPRMFNSNSNIDILIKSIPIVTKSYPDIKFIFVCHLGVDSYYLKLRELVDELDINSYCLFIDEIKASQMDDYYAISDVVISILSSDGMPATVLEAMAMRKPQILSEIPIYLEAFSQFASIAKLRDVKSTSEKIIESLKGGEALTKKLNNGYDWVTKNANQKLLNDDLENIYLKLMS